MNHYWGENFQQNVQAAMDMKKGKEQSMLPSLQYDVSFIH